jgi:hypothetical protein
MSDSDDTQALAANIRGDGAVAAPHDFLSSSSEEEEDEAPTLPMKKRKSKGGRLTARRKKTTRRVSGEHETPSPNTANNLLEGRVNDLENEVETVEGKLAKTEESRKQGSKEVGLLKQEIKLLKAESKALGAEEAAQEIRRLKAEVVVLSDTAAKATRLGDEVAIDKTTIKQLRTKLSNGTTAYEKLKNMYYQLKKDAAKAETALKKDVAALESRLKDKAAKLKQDETFIEAQVAARMTLEHKMKLKLEGEDYKAEKKKKEAEAKDRKRKASLGIANSVSSKGGGAFSIPQNEQERAAIFHPQGAHPQQQYYQPVPQYLQPQPQQYYHPQFLQPPPGYGHPMPMQQYQQPMQYQPTMQYQPGVSQIYPPPPTMERASSASSVTPPPPTGATYSDEELEQAIQGGSRLEIPDEDTQEEEVLDAEAVEAAASTQNSDLMVVEHPYD